MTATFKPTHVDSKLQSDWLYLHEQMPPEKWYHLPSFCTASTWLGMHQSLRRGQGEIEHLNQEYQNGAIEWQDYRHQLLHSASTHYGHLHGHHSVEDHHYFPKLRRREPKLDKGFDVLDSDHHQIEQQLKQIETLFEQLRQQQNNDPKLAEQLYQTIKTSGEWLYRHLTDEEDLVIPILAIQEQYRLT